MKIAIIGSRDFKDIKKVVELVKSFSKDTIIVSGGAPGVDSVAEMTAQSCGLNTKIFPADWTNLTHPNAVIKTNKYGKKYDSSAGLRRNEDIIKYADEVYAFWDGISLGTRNSIGHSHRLNKKITIIR